MFGFAKRTPIVVEEYRIEQVEQEGFKRLIVKLTDAKHHVHAFEFHPNHAHAFSDDLLRNAARALRPETEGE